VIQAVAAHEVSAPAAARCGPAFLRIVALLVCMLAVVPTVAAADGPTPDPSPDVRPDPAPVRSQTAPAEQRAARAHERPAPTGRSPGVPTRVVVGGPTTTAKATSGESAATRSTPVPASRRRTPAAARAIRSHEREQRPGHASAIATLRRLLPLLAAPPFPRPTAGSTSSAGNSGAQLLLFAAVALLLLVAASASLIRLTTRLSDDVRPEPGP
jgi:hypothetical protein